MGLWYAWSKAWSVFADIVRALVAKKSQRLKAVLSLGGSILVWIGTWGAVLAGTIVGLVVAIMDLIEDCNTLSKTPA